jgi:hypothetical protein
MDISINADVHCADGLCGQSTYVIINPVVKKVAHLVVKAMVFPHRVISGHPGQPPGYQSYQSCGGGLAPPTI